MADHSFTHFDGYLVKLDHAMVSVQEDWSRCRSPGRARRRHRLGIKTRRQIIGVPLKEIHRFGNMLTMHPWTYAQLKAQIAAQQKTGNSCPTL